MVKKISCLHCGKYIPVDSIYCPKCACPILKENLNNTNTSTVTEASIMFEEKLSLAPSNLVGNMVVLDNSIKETETEPIKVEEDTLLHNAANFSANESEKAGAETLEKKETKEQLSDINKKYVFRTIDSNGKDLEQSTAKSISNNAAKEMLEKASKSIDEPVKISSRGNIVINNTEILDSSEGITKEVVLHKLFSIVGIILIIILLVIILK